MDREYFHQDMRHFIDHRVDWARYFKLLRGSDGDVAGEVETFKAILGTLAEICEDIEAGAKEHWHEEVRLEDGRVVVPPHIASGYDKLRQAGLVCLILDARYGGYGLPILLNSGYLEMISRADTSLMTIVGLQAGVAGDIQKYGSEEIKQRYLPRFASGELQGCMDLTEPQAGSDLGGIATRVTEENGRFFIDGGKIFITNGGSDVHLVLARDAATYEQSKGTTNGLSLMLCPVVLPDGTRNSVRVSRVETKMGIHGSPTCAVEFEHAEAFLLGERGNGFRAMLDLMNQARLGVAAQAIGIAEAAYRQARNYAAERVQFGAPIIDQPLVKSMLTLMALNIQASRALLYRTCAMIDMTEAIARYLASDRDEPGLDRRALQEEHERNTQLVRFFTPLCKYYATEISSRVTRAGIQIHGGLGYMAESAAGHYHSDSIITTIYEGTSEIQASFALREMSKGALFTALEQTRADLEHLDDRFPEEAKEVTAGIAALTASLPDLMEDPRYALLNAKRVCDMVIHVVVAAELLFQAEAVPGKLELAASFIHRYMLLVDMHAKRIQSGDVSRLERYNRILGL
ncbi:MAG: acyl-CoA dehydrogenase family protein [Thermodesulfobacteriota bacterium]